MGSYCEWSSSFCFLTVLLVYRVFYFRVYKILVILGGRVEFLCPFHPLTLGTIGRTLSELGGGVELLPRLITAPCSRLRGRWVLWHGWVCLPQLWSSSQITAWIRGSRLMASATGTISTWERWWRSAAIQATPWVTTKPWSVSQTSSGAGHCPAVRVRSAEDNICRRWQALNLQKQSSNCEVHHDIWSVYVVWFWWVGLCFDIQKNWYSSSWWWVLNYWILSSFFQLCVEVTFVVPVVPSYPQASLIFIPITWTARGQ